MLPTALSFKFHTLSHTWTRIIFIYLNIWMAKATNWSLCRPFLLVRGGDPSLWHPSHSQKAPSSTKMAHKHDWHILQSSHPLKSSRAFLLEKSQQQNPSPNCTEIPWEPALGAAPTVQSLISKTKTSCGLNVPEWNVLYGPGLWLLGQRAEMGITWFLD